LSEKVGQARLDISRLAAGVYLVRPDAGQNSSCARLVVQR